MQRRRRSIDPHSDRALYRQLADILRRHIHDGELAPGDMLPSVPALQQEYDLGREAVRRGLAVLRAEGLIETLPGVGSMVRDAAHTETVMLEPGDVVTTRMPTPEERHELDLPEGVPVLVIQRDGQELLHPGDRTMLQVDGED